MRLIVSHLVVILSMMLFANFLHAQVPKGYTWQDIKSVDFGSGANHFSIKAASAGSGGEVELRLDAANGPVIGRAYFHHTGISNLYPDSSVNFMDYECALKQTVTGTHDVYMNFQDYSDPDSGGVLKTGGFQFRLVEELPVVAGNSLHIYPPVPGLEPSPYYDIYIQKVSELNSSNLAEVTNWKTPFAWFTQCPDYAANVDNKGYYSSYVGGWSNTYTNFELEPNTPIVVKIVRKKETGDDAPSGPIDTAVVRPANRVVSWEIIDGDVYITLSNPALVAVDIDGQMETRVSPRATSTGWDAAAFPYRNKKDGAHSVTIFANPFIKDKPKPGDPGVLVVKAGEKIPTTQELQNKQWDILYFEPGVHRASVDVDSQGNLVERRWQASDPITLQDNKTYYIPGDAIVYANFSDINRSNNQSVNIRIYGHGTVSGSKINHNKVEGEEYSNEGWWNRALYLRDAKNCHIEGVTAVDPAFHTLCIVSSVKNTYEPNTIKWTKVLAWRTNSDGTAVSGNTQMEDCFIRCQDDGHYIGGTTVMRRVVFWHDVNGQTFRGDFTNRRYSKDNAPNIPEQIIYEDIDVIYARGVFSTSNSSGFSIFGVGGGNNNETLKDGVENTGQMVYFRNINISDPLPCRKLISFDVEEKVGDYAGIRFENINYRGKQVFGWKNWLVGSKNAAIRNFVFDNVLINGQIVDQEYVNNPANFGTDNVFDITYRRRDTIPSNGYVLTSTATNGWITVNTTEGTPGKVSVTATPIAGYRFIGWSGDLSEKENEASIVIDRDKAITANFSLISYAISKTAVNGTVILEPALDKYLPGTVVTVKAVGNLGYGFVSWGGDLSGSVNPATITMDGDKNVSATFTVVPTYKISAKATNGSIILDSAGEVYSQGTDVTVTAKAEYGYEFSGWSGDLSGSVNPATLKMNSDKNIVANFKTIKGDKLVFAINCGGLAYTSGENVPYQADNSFSGGGTFKNANLISDTEDDILYQSERTGNFSYNINLPNGEYEVTLLFAEIFWNASGQRVFNASIEGTKVINQLDIYSKAGKNKPYEETHKVKLNDGVLNISFTTVVDNSKISAIKVVVPGPNFDLLTSAINGSISLNPAGGNYDSTTVVALTAKASAGYKFSGWSGDLTGSANPGSIVMDAKKVVIANFVPLPIYSVATEATNGSIALSPTGGSYTEGTRITITANPNKGYKFIGWSGDLTGVTNPESILLNGNKTIKALFEKIPTYTLTVNISNGTILLNPAGGIYEIGTAVTITVIPDAGYDFIGWSGDLSGKNNPATIFMGANKKVNAVVIPKPVYSLTIAATNGTVTPDPPGGSYLAGTMVTLKAKADAGYLFSEWSGDLSGSSNPTVITMNGNKNISAIFTTITSINNLTNEPAGSIQLFQNYPNPFQTGTTIPYSLNKASHVRIVVCNYLGQQVAALVNEFQNAGKYSVYWNAQNYQGNQLKSGLYLYRMETQNTVVSGRMLLIHDNTNKN